MMALPVAHLGQVNAAGRPYGAPMKGESSMSVRSMLLAASKK